MMTVHGSAAAAYACLQPGATAARRETKSDTPDGPLQPSAAREALAAAVAGLVPDGRAQPLADALAACLEGNALCFTRLDAQWHGLVCYLPTEAWSLLDGLAGEGGIVRVAVPQAVHSDELELLAQGLAVLPALAHLDLPVPRSGGAIDLSAMHARQQPLVLRLHCVRPDGWRITVPQDCRVQATGPVARQAHLLKPKVAYVDRQGQPTGESHALPGVPYLAKPPESVVEACQGDAKAARRMALGINTNGRAQFDGKGGLSGDAPADRTIWCRHIAWKVGEDWRVRRGLQQVGMPATMSYEPYSTPGALAAHVEPEVQAAYDRDFGREAAAVFTDRGFGEALQVQFDTLAPGQERIFLLATMQHAMTLELRRKGRHCIVTQYDPNVSTVPLKLLVSDPSDLRAFALGDLLGPRYQDYVPLAAFVPAALFASGGASERASGPCRLHGFTPDVLASREGLYWLLRSGAATDIDRAVQAIVAIAEGKDNALLMARLSARYEGYSGLVDALFWRRRETVDAYIQAIQRHALPVIGEAGVAYLLEDIPRQAGVTLGRKDGEGKPE